VPSCWVLHSGRSKGLILFRRILIPFITLGPLWLSHFPKGSPLNTVMLDIGLNMNFGWKTTSRPPQWPTKCSKDVMKSFGRQWLLLIYHVAQG
jgi:hypothetical protein